METGRQCAADAGSAPNRPTLDLWAEVCPQRRPGAPAWQPARKAVERALCIYDWGEAFTAVNLVLRPTLDDLWLRQLATGQHVGSFR